MNIHQRLHQEQDPRARRAFIAVLLVSAALVGGALGVVVVLGGAVEEHDGARLLVRATDPAALNARLVGDGVRVEVLAPERRSLEDVVLAAAGASADRFTGPSPAPAPVDGPREVLER